MVWVLINHLSFCLANVEIFFALSTFLRSSNNWVVLFLSSFVLPMNTSTWGEDENLNYEYINKANQFRRAKHIFIILGQQKSDLVTSVLYLVFFGNNVNNVNLAKARSFFAIENK